MGHVYKSARHPAESNSRDQGSAALTTGLEATLREGSADHRVIEPPHICTLHDVGQQDGIDYLVMEFLEGETLAQRLERGALSLQEALNIAIETADALDKAHRQGIVHRDLKPGNVMLTKTGVKLLDFGLAKPNSFPGQPAGSGSPPAAADLTGQGAIIGALQYMAPEQLDGDEADARADIFAFGSILYEMITGRRAFEGKSQASLIAAILERMPQPIASFDPLAIATARPYRQRMHRQTASHIPIHFQPWY